MTGEPETGGELVEVSGVVYGVHLRGRLPAAFREYLLPAPGGGAETPDSLEVRHRLVDDLPEVEEVWVSETEAPDPEGPEAPRGRFALFRLPGGFGLTVADEGRGRFRCTSGEIAIEWTEGAGTGAAHYLFTYALPLWLETRGVPVLHASAVSVGGRAVAFVGATGMGKSLLSAELLYLGCGFVADDGLAVRQVEGRDREGGWRAFHGPPLLRLWPSGLEGRLGIAARDLPRVHETLDKRQWTPPPGTADADPGPPEAGLPLAAVYVLRRRPPDGGPVEVSEHAPRDALVRLLEHGVAASPAAALGISARRLELLGDLAETVPVRELRFPGGAGTGARIFDAIASE